MGKSTALLEAVDFFRLDANRQLDRERRSHLGQFMTPPETARLMASMFHPKARHIRLLDPGAGVGSLTAAFVAEMCSCQTKPKSITATAYEIDAKLSEYLADTLTQCQSTCEQAGIDFQFELIEHDFIDAVARMLRGKILEPVERFNCAILNPPYKKINADSETRLMLREIGIETSNLYTGFLSVALKLMASAGELVAITPRSFCNGPYFKRFRRLLLDTLAIRRIHVFDSRQVAFSDDDVLQENVILHGIKGASKRMHVGISSSAGPADDFITIRSVPYEQVVRRNDPEHFIHIVPDGLGASVAEKMSLLHSNITDLGLEVSTGRVVDFRATQFLCDHVGTNTVPLIYPRNFEEGFIKWPKPGGKKPEAMAVLPGAEALLVPNEIYVLVKRFSAKEENRRIVAAIYDPRHVKSELVGFENHTNFFHIGGRGLPSDLAKGITGFLNTGFVDVYFRQFSGHTQVNATDLRNMKYPTKAQLEELGSQINNEFPAQDVLDRYLEEVLNLPAATAVNDPLGAKKKIEEAGKILKLIDVPRAQLNERSALTLLSLLNLKPDTLWTDAANPLMGISPMMEFFEKHYGKKYAPNTREAVRRQTIHQFLDAGIVIANPDKPSRPTNSRKAVYQIETGLLDLIRLYGGTEWEKGLKTYLASVKTLKTKYAQERIIKRIPIQVAPGKQITLSPGGQNVLIKNIVDDFCSTFTAGGKLVYVGDTDNKWAYYDEELLRSLGVTIDAHGKMPDVVVYAEAKNWLVLIEAVTSHGPVSPKRRNELKALFKKSKAGLVFVTAFLDRRAMLKYLNDISWETEVWVADAPTHLIHFNGERFLGPYED